MDKIYVITTIEIPSKFSSHAVGWYHSFEDAEKAVLENMSGIDECLYDYVVIEEISQGTYCLATQESWYEWIDRKYQKSEKPKGLKGIISFGIG